MSPLVKDTPYLVLRGWSFVNRVPVCETQVPDDHKMDTMGFRTCLNLRAKITQPPGE